MPLQKSISTPRRSWFWLRAVLWLALAAGSPVASATDLRVATVTRLNTNGGRIVWDKSGSNLIAYDRRPPGGYYNVYLMTTHGDDVASLTQGNSLLPGKHAGNPAWHPSGQLLVVQAERQSYANDALATPGVGVGNDLWFISTNGSNAWRMDTVTLGGYSRPAGILHPHFSHSGNLLIWAEFIAPGGTFGVWRLKLADFGITNGVPGVSNVRTYNPGGGSNFFETHNFSPEDSKFLYTSSQDTFLELYSFDIASGTSTRLTTDPAIWDEHGQYSPDGKNIVWMASHGLAPTNGTYPTEYWGMDANGANQVQLSWFNFNGHQHFLGLAPVVASDLDWSPNGSQIVAYLQAGQGQTNESDYDVLITFAPSNTPVALLPASAEMIYTAPVPGELDASHHVPVAIYAMDTEGRTITRLTFDGATYIHAAVSPDRRKVAATRAENDTNGNGALDAGDTLSLWVLDLIAGTERAIVTNYNAGLGGVDWSADSRDIYCSMTQTSTNYDIYRIRADGSSVTPVTTNLLADLGQAGTRKWVSDVSVSPDGQWLAFIFTPAQGATGFRHKTQVGICRTDGTQAQLITDGGSLPPQQLGSQSVGDFDPELSPDNQFIVFQRVTAAGLVGSYPSGDIYSARVSDGALTAISPTNQVVISGIPDGALDQRILYSEWNPSLARIGPVLARPDGSGFRRLDAGLNGSHFKWIPPAWPETTLALKPATPAQGNLNWFAAANFIYQIEMGSNFTSHWQTMGAPIVGSNLLTSVPITVAPGPARFYRLNVNVSPRDITP